MYVLDILEVVHYSRSFSQHSEDNISFLEPLFPLVLSTFYNQSNLPSLPHDLLQLLWNFVLHPWRSYTQFLRGTRPAKVIWGFSSQETIKEGGRCFQVIHFNQFWSVIFGLYHPSRIVVNSGKTILADFSRVHFCLYTQQLSTI